MALTWEKLTKLQSDFPKPKFAIHAIEKRLKKRPGDPYLLAWKAESLLAYDAGGTGVLKLLDTLLQHQPPLADSKLLVYVYHIHLEAERQSVGHPLSPVSAGGVVLKALLLGAQSLPTAKARCAFWSDLFLAALKEDCWEDVRYILVQAKNEGLDNKRNWYYSSILANQLAAEKKTEIQGPSAEPDTVSKIQLHVALRYMKDGYLKQSDEDIRIKDMDGLRFMGDIFRRQNRLSELFDLWDYPPPALQAVIEKQRGDFMILKVEVAAEGEDWTLAEKYCLEAIDEALKSTTESTKHLVDLCATSWSLWGTFVAATSALYSDEEAVRRTKQLLNRFVEVKGPLNMRGRGTDLTHMCLEALVRGPELYQLIKDYWLHNSSRSTVFPDLRRIVVQLPLSKRQEFHDLITHGIKAGRPKEFSYEPYREWMASRNNVLKFDYLLRNFGDPGSDEEALEQFVDTALNNCLLCLMYYGGDWQDAGYLAILGLLHLHHKHPVPNRYLLQATMLARHLTNTKAGKKNRPLMLLAGRLHLNLGLGTSAFQLYKETKVKEMLQDTVGWVMLSRISQTHPFDVEGPMAFSVDDELARLIATVSRMEARADEYLVVKIGALQYDKAIDLREYRNKMKSSMSKHACMIDRRRIARLRGEHVDSSLRFDFKDYWKITDNRDPELFPNFGKDRENTFTELIMRYRPVTAPWLYQFETYFEPASVIAYKESANVDFREVMVRKHLELAVVGTTLYTNPNLAPYSNRESQPILTNVEIQFYNLWQHLAWITEIIRMAEEGKSIPHLTPFGEWLHVVLRSLNGYLAKVTDFRIPDSITKLEDETFVCDEEFLMYCYGLLEILRVVIRAVGRIAEVPDKKNKEHALRKWVTKELVAELTERTNTVYNELRELVQSYIDQIKKCGKKVICAQVCFGKTGKELLPIMTREDVEWYAQEYVDSAIEALSGILKVKLDDKKEKGK